MTSRWPKYGNKIIAVLGEITIFTTSEDTGPDEKGRREGRGKPRRPSCCFEPGLPTKERHQGYCS